MSNKLILTRIITIIIILLIVLLTAFVVWRTYDYYIGRGFNLGTIDDTVSMDSAEAQKTQDLIDAAQVITFGGDGASSNGISVSSDEVHPNLDPSAVLLGAQNHIDTIPDNMSGWLIVDGVDVNDPVMQTTDNSFYLTHNELGEKSTYGCYYFSCNNYVKSIAGLDRKTLVFGHSNGNSTNLKFSTLKMFKDKDFASKNRYIHLVIDGQNSDWEIFAVSEYPIDHTDLMDVNPSNEVFKDEVITLKKLSYNIYNTNVQYSDKVIYLVTCTGAHKYDTRYIVAAKLVK